MTIDPGVWGAVAVVGGTLMSYVVIRRHEARRPKEGDPHRIFVLEHDALGSSIDEVIARAEDEAEREHAKLHPQPSAAQRDRLDQLANHARLAEQSSPRVERPSRGTP